MRNATLAPCVQIAASLEKEPRMRALCLLMALAGVGIFAFPLAAAPTDSGQPSRADQKIGKRFRITPDVLPEPYATQSVDNSPLTIPFSGQKLRAPDGFSITAF